jgi:hypothetical protein
MGTNSSSLNHCVDLFFTIGAMRGQDKDRLIRNFSLALLEDPTRAMKILFWVRDIRGGAGERQVFRDVMKYLAEDHTDFLRKNIPYISEFGRWDDLLALVGTKLEEDAFTQIRNTISQGKYCQKILDNLDSYSEEECEEILKNLSNI